MSSTLFGATGAALTRTQRAEGLLVPATQCRRCESVVERLLRQQRPSIVPLSVDTHEEKVGIVEQRPLQCFIVLVCHETRIITPACESLVSASHCSDCELAMEHIARNVGPSETDRPRGRVDAPESSVSACVKQQAIILVTETVL